MAPPGVGVWLCVYSPRDTIFTFYFMMQAVLVASHCNPRWLTKHLESLASSRSVPLIFVKDDKEGSLRLGELVKLKTALAIGIKVRSCLAQDLYYVWFSFFFSNKSALAKLQKKSDYFLKIS